MTRRLLLGYLAVTAFTLVVLGVPLGATFADHERDELIADVRHDAMAIAVFAVGVLQSADQVEAASVVEQYEARTGGRAVIVDAGGAVVADSDPAVPGERNFATRPEVAAALRGEEAEGFRYSDTLASELLYVAVPVETAGVRLGAVRITYPSSFVGDRIERMWLVLAAVGVLVVAFVTLLGLRVAQAVTRPVRALEEASGRFGEGDLTARVAVPAGPPEMVALARGFNETAAKVERLVGAQRDFVADASHQLRTPLAALRLRLEILEGDVEGAAREDVEAALAEVHRLGRLVEGVLARARAEHVATAPVATDLAAVVAERVAVWAPLADEQGLALVADTGDAAVALATPGHVEQALDNLVANAIDASPPGTTVTVRARRDGEWAVVEVVDQGPGMSEDRRSRAFDRSWHRPDGDGRVGGYGIGLSIVRNLVVADRGEVELQEADGGGLCARIRLLASRTRDGAGAR